MTHAHFVEQTFTVPAARADRFTVVLREHLSEDEPLRILDLGCGSGHQLFDLALHFRRAQLTGIDISELNVEVARHAAKRHPAGSRVSLVAADYRNWPTEPFDVIISDSVLQNIADGECALMSKVARDLRPGGMLVVTIPNGCLYNHALWMVRRMLRPLSCAFLDRLLNSVARRLHPDWDPALIEERVGYMYLVPYRWDSRSFRDTLATRHGLKLLSAVRLKAASWAQPRHTLLVFRREMQ